MKPLDQLTIDDIDEMSEVDVESYYQLVGATIVELRFSIAAKVEKHHNLSMILKKRGVGFADFQREAYEITQEIKNLKAQIMNMELVFVKIKRAWEKRHGKNQVGKFVQNKQGTWEIQV
jgi:hypothetical protein